VFTDLEQVEVGEVAASGSRHTIDSGGAFDFMCRSEAREAFDGGDLRPGVNGEIVGAIANEPDSCDAVTEVFPGWIDHAGQEGAKRSVQREDGLQVVASLALMEEPDCPRMAFDED
jgi:hypothetical protein